VCGVFQEPGETGEPDTELMGDQDAFRLSVPEAVPVVRQDCFSTRTANDPFQLSMFMEDLEKECRGKQRDL